jgi:hypothetical protein
MQRLAVLGMMSLRVASTFLNEDAQSVPGSSLAQSSMGLQATGALSGETDPFASLQDTFDDHQTLMLQPSVEGKGSAQTVGGGRMSSTAVDPLLSSLHILDDNFGDNVWHQSQEHKEPFPSFAREWLTKPPLYFAIALVLIGRLILSLSSGRPAVKQQLGNAPVVEQHDAPVVPRLQLSAPGISHLSSANAVRTTCEEPFETAVGKMQSASESDTDDTDSLVEEKGSPTFSSDDPLFDAMRACRAGQSGSYAALCAILSAKQIEN